MGTATLESVGRVARLSTEGDRTSAVAGVIVSPL